jgi:phosphoenolpyruvate carboxykinase (ATP)
MKIPHTRAMVTAALDGTLATVPTVADPVFGLCVPERCPGVPDDVLQPRNTWADKDAYDAKARDMAHKFVQNFKQFEKNVHPAVIAAGPQI